MTNDADPLTDDDRALLTAITAEDDPAALVARVHAYYRDADRAERTPVNYLYLHLGFLSGTIMKLLRAEEGTTHTGAARPPAPQGVDGGDREKGFSS